MTGSRISAGPRPSARAVGTLARKAPAKPTTARALAAWTGRRPGLLLGAVAVVVAGTAVSWNVLVHQTGRHPAPLFGAKPSPAAIQRHADAAPLPAPLPAPRPDIAGPVSTQSIPEPPRVPASDPIGSLIRSSQSAPTRTSDPKPEARTDTGRVASVQKALSRLGYGPLKADGLMGVTTRQAIERYERDQKLPVTGSLDPRTTRQLASASGLPID